MTNLVLFCWFTSNIEPSITQYATRAVTVGIVCETRYTENLAVWKSGGTILPPLFNKQRHGVPWIFYQYCDLKTWAPCESRFEFQFQPCHTNMALRRSGMIKRHFKSVTRALLGTCTFLGGEIVPEIWRYHEFHEFSSRFSQIPSKWSRTREVTFYLLSIRDKKNSGYSNSA